MYQNDAVARTSRGRSGGRAGVDPAAAGPPVAASAEVPVWLGRAALVAVALLAGVLATRQVASLDVGFHLAAGERVLSGQGWPRTDPFTYTVSDRAYIDTSWGFQLLAALAQRTGGAGGLVLLQVALVLGTLLALYRTARLQPASPTWLALLLGLGVVASEMRFEIRPELVSYLLLALLLHVLQRHALGLPAPLGCLPAIFLIWVNGHGLFVLGWGALGCALLGAVLSGGGLDRRLAAWSAAAVAVTLINPYGLAALTFPLTLATRMSAENAFNQSIGEFVSPFALRLSEQFPFYPRAPLAAYHALLGLGLIAAWRLARARRFAALLCLALFGALSTRMIRNLPLLVVGGLPATLWGLQGLPALARRRVQAALAVATCLACLGLGLRAWHDAYYIASRRTDRSGLGWNRLALPIEAAQLAAERLDGPVLNHLNFGGYLIWAWRRPVFVDGRLEVLGESFFEQYRQIMETEDGLERALARWGIRWVVLPPALAPGLLRRLSRDERFALLHVDPVAAVFVRAEDLAPGERALAGPLPQAPAPADLALLPGLGARPRRGALAGWVAGLFERERFPAQSFNLGLFHYFRGEWEPAAGLFARAIGESDGAYYEMYQNLGAALFRVGRLAEAEACYRVVLDDAPGNARARERLREIRRLIEAGPAGAPVS
jgi:tetratricopeptide (TPR) repeat protein